MGEINARSTPGGFFERTDWFVFGTVFALAFLLYFHTLAPTVTLEDAGELIVAADYLGVPHPPGYPIWTLTAGLFRWLFRWVRFYGRPESNWMLLFRSARDAWAPGGPGGYPNPAFGVNLCSAFWGALACALLALLVRRSGADALGRFFATADADQRRRLQWISAVSAISAGCLWACSHALWSQSVIAEVYSLNAFFQTLILLLLYRWMRRPEEPRPLLALAFAFGLGLTNHQTLLFLGPAIALGISLRDRKLFAALAANAAVWIALAGFNFWAARAGRDAWLWTQGPAARSPAFWWQTGLALAAPTIFALRLPRGGRAAAFVYLVLLGLAFYLYLPIAAEQSPPMNWGNPRTWSQLLYVIGRSQYERIQPADFLSMGYLRQLAAFGRDLQRQFSTPIALLGAVPFLLWPWLRRGDRGWLAVTLAGFLGVSLIFLTFQNPRLDVHTLFIARVQFIQSHALWALWIGYGALAALAGIAGLYRRADARRIGLYGGLIAALALPVFPLRQNARNLRLIRMYGGAEQNGHIFGWMFGHWLLDGWEAIRRDLGDAAADYPTPGYPEPMAPGAILFGGSDPGRFVTNYLTFSARIRPDIFVLTQNGLADRPYLQQIRDLYGDRIWLPSAFEHGEAFTRYHDRAARRGADAGHLRVNRDGLLTVVGVDAVMEINADLAWTIFLRNPSRRFYVEESYPIAWMSERMEPSGLILELKRRPVELTDEIAARDRAFWDWLTRRLVADPRYRRDVIARKTFAGLRATIASVYARHRRFADAEHAFRQAIELYPLSPEGTFRLADMYAGQGRYSDAREVSAAYVALDPENEAARQYLRRMEDTAAAARRLQALAARRADASWTVSEALELTDLYGRFGRWNEFRESLGGLIAQPGLTAPAYLEMARLALNANDMTLLEAAQIRFLALEPGRQDIWLDLAAVQLARGARAEAEETLNRARRAGHVAAVEKALGTESRFAPLRAETPAPSAAIP